VQAWLRKLQQHRRTPSERGGAEKDAGAAGAAGAGCEHEERVGRVLTEWLVHHPPPVLSGHAASLTPY